MCPDNMRFVLFVWYRTVGNTWIRHNIPRDQWKLVVVKPVKHIEFICITNISSLLFF